jgi:hypothetical protein
MDLAHGAALPATSWRPWRSQGGAEVAFLIGEQPAAERIARRLFGRLLHPREYAGLAAAPDDAKVEVGASDGKLYIELHDPVAAAYCGYFYLYCREAVTVLLNDGFRINVRAMRRRGLGLQMFHRQMRNAAVLGIDRIDAVAGRAHDENGYYTWPRYGFQGALPAAIRLRLPLGLEHSRTILDLMSCEEGRDWWGEHGVTIPVRFTLAPGSRSQLTLAQYVHERFFAGGTPCTHYWKDGNVRHVHASVGMAPQRHKLA